MKSIQWPTAVVCIVFVLVVGALLFFGKTVPAGWVGMAGTIVASFMQAILGGGSAPGGGQISISPGAKVTITNGPVPPAAARIVLAGAALALCACVGGVPTPQTVQDVTIGLNAAVCVFETYSADRNAGKSEGDTIADCAIKCGVSAAQASGLLDAHRKAEVAEGFVPKPDAGK